MNPDDKVRAFNPKRNHLFIIGIDEYEHATNLENCVSDAEAFKSILLEKYQFENERVKTLYNSEASEEAIIDHFQAYSKNLGKDDNLIVFFSGHGYFDKVTRIGYLVPTRGMVNSVTTLIPHVTIKSYLTSLKVHHCLFIVDSCYSGNLLLSKRDEFQVVNKESIEAYALKNNSFPSRWGMAAGKIEKVDDGLVGDYSPYAKSIVSFLTHNNYEAFAVSDLIYHTNRVTTYNSSQTPIGGPIFETGDEGGEFLFIKKRLNEQELNEKYEEKISRVQRGNERSEVLNPTSPLREMIAMDQLEESLQLLRERASGRDADTLLLLTAQLNALNRDNTQGVISSSDYKISRNRIRASLLQMEKRVN